MQEIGNAGFLLGVPRRLRGGFKGMQFPWEVIPAIQVEKDNCSTCLLCCIVEALCNDEPQFLPASSSTVPHW